MNSKEKISQAVADLDNLTIVKYPDPRLREQCTEIEEFDDDLRDLAEKMHEIMFRFKGVGLAAPQVGVTVQLFLASPEFNPEETYAYVNPRIVASEGAAPGEEGCLSFPGIYSKVKRAANLTVEYEDLDGVTYQESCSDFHARIIQHEGDHLAGTLLVDRMGSVAKLASRKALAHLEEEFSKKK